MKKILLFSVIALSLGAISASAQDKKAGPAAPEVKAAGKKCADCPMHKKAAAAAEKTINCPEAKGAKKHDCANCGGKMCPEKVPGASAIVTNTKDGVEVNITAKDKDAVARIQALAAPHYENKGNKCAGCPTTVRGAETKFEYIPAGIKVTITAQAPEAVKQIQAAAAKEFSGPAPKAEAAKGKQEAKASKKYTCPMKCVISDKPGKCPKCGMPMEEIK
ncbi:MAG TPA: heavy metal-binding domain-containing protein [Elusimicrobiales bacterium]|nr:heavy metal-binding domain-containing protein [Elusimicrobiales bacterium]